MKSIAIVCASGMGDALLMQIAAHHLRAIGYETTTFSTSLLPLQSWFPHSPMSPQPPLDQIEQLLAPFDAILLQHDNTPKARAIRALPKPVYTLYASHLISKHGPLRPNLDFLFDRTLCMAQNIQRALATLFHIDATTENGLTPPPGLLFQKYLHRIALHPTSTSPQKNWLRPKFLQLRDKLREKGYTPVFITPPEEAADWDSPLFPNLAALASFLYESAALIGNDSGPGHLASNLGLPTLTIGPSREHLALWRPGWAPGKIVHPADLLTKTKLTRTNWKRFISVTQVIKEFSKLSDLK